MTQEEAVALISDGIDRESRIWADLGAGSGNFTIALDQILGFDGTIFAIDQKLNILRERIKINYLRSKVHLYESDLSTAASMLPPLDGILMANTLHYIKDQEQLLTKIISMLKPGGSFILVEYDLEVANQWIPYPISFISWQRLALHSGFTLPEEVGRNPSIYANRQIYAALCYTARETL